MRTLLRVLEPSALVAQAQPVPQTTAKPGWQWKIDSVFTFVNKVRAGCSLKPAAWANGARVAVLPCCHDRASCDAGPRAGWRDDDVAIDVTRAMRLEARGYQVHTLLIPPSITPKNRLLVAAPRGQR